MPYIELTISLPDSFRAPFLQKLSASGSLGVIEQDRSLAAYFPDTDSASAAVGMIERECAMLQELLLAAGLSGSCRVQRATVPDQDWNAVWKQSFQPLAVGRRFRILPPWEQRQQDRLNIIIDPAMAFGTGHHETTRSCLILLERYTDAQGKFLDLGTGTGILAIAASLLGFRTVIAVDTDPLAVEATRHNAALNGIDTIDVRQGSLAGLSGTFACVAANLVSGVLVQLMPELFRVTAPGGICLLSGILATQVEEVAEAAVLAGFAVQERYSDNEWISLVVRHTPAET